jgi:non-ribosomal peptide synthetase component F
LLPSEDWRSGPGWSSSPWTLHEGFARFAASNPHHTVMATSWGSVSHRELDLRAGRWARLLNQAGVRRGDFVPIVLPRGAELVTAVGVPITQRTDPGLAGTIGCHINTLAVRLRGRATRGGDAGVRAVAGAANRAFADADVPFDALARRAFGERADACVPDTLRVAGQRRTPPRAAAGPHRVPTSALPRPAARVACRAVAPGAR